MGVPGGEFAAVPEPADIGKASGRFFEPGHSRVIDQGKSRAALPQKVGKVRINPASMAHLDGGGRAFGKPMQERIQNFHALDRETGRELKKEWAELIAEGGHGAYESTSGVLATHEVLFVRDLPGVLYTTRKHTHPHHSGPKIVGITRS